MSQQASSSVIRLTQPASGQTVTVPVDADNMRMSLGFEPDPNAVQKNGQNLEFSFEDGGTLVLEGYYDHFASKTLPVMVTEGGDELAGEDFLASLREDLLTAAGPSAGPSGVAGSGSGNYADDPGALIDGIGRLGSLGTIYWDRNTEIPEWYNGEEAETPFIGNVGFSVVTNVGGVLYSGLFEDGFPRQHMGLTDPTQDLYLGHLQMQFSSGGTTIVTAVHLAGFHQGTVVYLAPDFSTPLAIVGPDGLLDLTAAQLAAGIFLRPPHNSDVDMTNITSTIDITAESSGASMTITGPVFDIVVDAVADKPSLAVVGFEDTPSLTGDMSMTETANQGHKDGWAEDELNKGNTTTSAENVIVSAKFTAAITFGDFDSSDNSEAHYALVEAPNSDPTNGLGTWIPTVDSPAGVALVTDVNGDPVMLTLWFDSNGKVIGEGATAPAGAASSKTFFQFEVSGTSLDANGNVEIDLTFTSDNTNITADKEFTLEVGSKAQENPTDNELGTSGLPVENNASYTFMSDGGGSKAVLKVDTIDSQLEIKFGWASEGGKNDKHTSGPYAPDYSGMVDNDGQGGDAGNQGVASASTKVDGAPINIALGGTGGTIGDASDEVITQVILTLPDGTLYVDGTALASGYDGAINGVHYTVSGNKVTMTPVDDNDPNTFDSMGRDLSGHGLAFKPNMAGDNAFNHDDLDGIKYEITVTHPDTGASGVFKGESSFVVDAVADRAVIDTPSASEYANGNSAAALGETVSITGKLTFPDSSEAGNEKQYILLNVGSAVADGWALESGAGLLSQDNVYDIFKGVGGTNLPCNGLVTPTGNATTLENILIEVTVTSWNANGTPNTWEAQGVNANGSKFTIPSLVVTRGADGALEYSIPVTAPGTGGDYSSSIEIKSVTVVEDPNPSNDPGKEYDYANNIAGGNTETVIVKVDVISSGLFVSFKMDEDNEPNQNTAGEAGNGYVGKDYGLPLDLKLVEVDAIGNIRVDENGAPISSVSPDFISSVTVATVPSGEGTIYFNGVVVAANSVFTLDASGNVWLSVDSGVPTNLGNGATLSGGFTFRPADDWSGDYKLDITVEISSSTSSSTVPGVIPQEAPGQESVLHVNSVADLAEATAAATGRGAGGSADMTPNALEHDGKGWAFQTAGDSTEVRVSLDVSGKFTDMDGSETGTVRILLPQGFSIPTGAEYETVTDGAGTYLQINLGALDAGTCPVTICGITIQADGTYSGKIDVVVASGTSKTDLRVEVITTDPDTGKQGTLTDNTATKTITTPVDVEYFSGTLTVKAGWIYEGNKGAKHDSNVTNQPMLPNFDSDAMAYDAGKGITGAVPINVAFAAGSDGDEKFEGVSFSWNTDAGDFYVGGLLINNPPARLDAQDVEDGAKLFFVPKLGYSDEDIDISYTAVFKDKNSSGNEIEFTVNGKVDIVVDSVADKMDITNVEADYTGTQTAAVAGEGVAVKFTVAVTEDTSEAQFVFIKNPGTGSILKGLGENNIDGLTLLTPQQLIDMGLSEAMDGMDLTGYYVYVVNPGVSGTLDVSIPVTTMTKAELEAAGKGGADVSEVLDIKTVVVEGKEVDGNVIKVHGNDEDAWGDRPPAANNEYDFTNNVAVTDKSVTVAIGVVTSNLTLALGNAYEDSLPNQHDSSKTQTEDAGARIFIGGLAQGESITELKVGFTAPVDVNGDPVADAGSFVYNGNEYTIPAIGQTSTLTADGSSITIEYKANGTVSLTITDYNAPSSNTHGTNTGLWYKPGANNSDVDIKDVSFEATVKDNASGDIRDDFNNTDSKGTIVIDAVADQPLKGEGEVTSYDGNALYAEADWGSRVVVEVTSKFGDYEDGSENHYLLIEARVGWSCANADGVIEVNGTLYFYKDAGVEQSQDVSFYFNLNAPSVTDTTAPDHGTIKADGAVNLKAGGLAIEGGIEKTSGSKPGSELDPLKITNDSATTAAVDKPAPAGSDQGEIRTDNNVAINTDTVAIDFNVLNGSSGTANGTFEDGNANKHHELGGTPAGEPVTAGEIAANNGLVTIKVSGNTGDTDDTGDRITVGGNNFITFTFKGDAADLGTFSYTDAGGTTHHLTPDPIPASAGEYTLEIPDAAIKGGTSVELTYNPTGDGTDLRYDATDLTNVEYTIDIHSTTSSATGTESGLVNKGTDNAGKLVVDAVADRPELASDSIDKEYVGPTQTAAVSGGKVNIIVKDVQFNDYEDGSEKHYLVVQTTGIKFKDDDGNAGTCSFDPLSSQTIKIAGPVGISPALTVYQEVFIGTDDNDSYIRITDSAGGEVYKEFFSNIVGVNYDDVVGAVGSELKIGSEGYAKIPVLNEFLQLTDGEVTNTTVEMKTPSRQTVDTGYDIKAGGHAEDSESDTALFDKNDTATELGTTHVDVGVVTSSPVITMTQGNIFENLTPNAHLDLFDYNPGDPLPAGAIPVPDDTGAVMKLSGIAKGETADITLTFSAKDGSDVDYSGGTVTVSLDGKEFPVSNFVHVDTDNDGINDSYQAVIDGAEVQREFGDLDGKELQIVFDPGNNNSHEDISIDCSVTVTDTASGDKVTWNTTDPKNQPILKDADGNTVSNLEVQVDAVAQAVSYEKWSNPDGTTNSIRTHGGVENAKEGGIKDDDVYSHVERGQSVFLDTIVNMSDLADGSQGVVLLVEATTAMLKPTSVIVGALVDGEYKEFTISYDASGTPQRVGDGMFYKIEIPADILEKLTGTSGNGKIDVRYELNSSNVPGGTVTSDIRVGVITYEKAGVVLVQGTEAEATLDNNQSLVITGTGTVKFEGKPSFSINAKDWVSENDMPGANTGDFAKAGGTVLNFNVSADSVVSDLVITIQKDASGNPLGTLTLNGEPCIPGTDGTIIIGEFGHTKDKLVFTPAENNLDGDITISYTGTVTNTTTGKGQTINGNAEVVVDAVAQVPSFEDMQMWDSLTDGWVSIPNTGIKLTHGTNIGEGQTQKTGPLLINTSYPDTDGSENHYALVKVLPNTSLKFRNENGTWESCTETFFHKGVEYYKVPVYGTGKDKSVQVDITFDSRKLGHDHATDELTIKAMTEERVSESDGNKEKDYDNNVAVSDGSGSITIDHNWPPGDTIWIDPAYENNTHIAHRDDENDNNNTPTPGQLPDETPHGGGTIYFGSVNGEAIVSATLTVPAGAGTIYHDGIALTGTDNADGSVTYSLTEGQFGKLSFVPDKNYSDTDVDIKYTVTGKDGATANGTFPVVVDAVAQMPGVSDTPIAPDYDNTAGNWTAVGDAGNGGNEGVAKITITGEFRDNPADPKDTSEAHYALLEKKPGFVICKADGTPLDVETVYLPISPNDPNGATKAYYKVPMGAGESSVDVYVKVSDFDDNKFEIQTGVMTVEEGHKQTGDTNYESDMSNNVSWNIEDGQGAVIEYSPVDTTITLNVDNTGEHGEAVNGQNGSISITVTLGANDTINDLSISFNKDAGKIVWDGGENDSGSLNLKGLLPGINWSTATETEINDALHKLGLKFETIGYGDADTGLKLTANVTDAKSGDTANITVSDGVIVDAIGHGPTVTDVNGVSASGQGAAQAGEVYYAEVTLSFDDVAAGEHHYAMMGQHTNWPCTGVQYQGLNTETGAMEWRDGTLITFFDQKGKPYYALQVKDGMLDVNGEIEVRFEVKAPTTGKDISNEVTIGGVSVDPNMGTTGDRELDLINNWDESLANTVELKVGVVDTENVAGSSQKSDEVQTDTAGGDRLIQLEFTTDDGSQDVVTGLVITMPVDGTGNSMGTFWYDGVSCTGNLTITAFDPTKGPFFEPNEYWSGTLNITYTATVKDSQSGSSSEENAYSGTIGVEVTAVATDPTTISDGTVKYSGNATAVGSGANVTFSVEATFPDHDGSETHYILVEAKSGWGAPEGWNVNTHVYYTDNGTQYYKVPVPANATYDADGKVVVNITMKTPSGITVDGAIDGPDLGALASENGVDKPFFDGKDVDVTIGVVQSTAGDLGATAVSTFEDATTASSTPDPSQLQFSLSGNNNETITSITVTLPAGGSIYLKNADGSFSRVKIGGTATLDGAKAMNGDYYFTPPANVSGDINLNYTATVKDSASNVTQGLKGSVTVAVTAVTDGAILTGGMNTVTGADIPGHTAGVNVKLSGNFPDADGSEVRFFLISLPVGVKPAPGWVAITDQAWLDASGLQAPVYRVDVPTGHKAAAYTSADYSLEIDGSYANGSIHYVGGSYEKTLVDNEITPTYDPDAVKLSTGSNTITIDQGTGIQLNIAPDAKDSLATSDDFLRTENPTASGTLEMGKLEGGKIVDVDGDTVSITNVTCEGTGASTSNGLLVVVGKYGTLTINPNTGEYTYELRSGEKPPHGYEEKFDVSVTDNYAANQMGDTAKITITLNGENSAPTASEQYATSGGVNEAEFGLIHGQFVMTDTDTAGDEVVVLGASITHGGQTYNATWNATSNCWVLAGEFGNFSIAKDGSYTYIQTNEQGLGVEDITLNFKDILYTKQDGTPVYGDEGSAHLKITVNGVNHAPEATNSQLEWDAGGHSIQKGTVSFTDQDAGQAQNDTAAVAWIQSNGEPLEVAFGDNTILEGEYGRLQIWSNGKYSYTLLDGVNASQVDAWDVFTYTVKDSGGLTDQAEINIKIGEPAGSPEFFAAESNDLFFAANTVPQHIDGLDAGMQMPVNDMSDQIYGNNGDMVTANSNNALYDVSACEATWMSGDLALGGADAILDFSMGEDKLFLENLFSTPPMNMLEALEGKIGNGLDISVNPDGSAVQVTMDGQMVDIHLNDNLGPDVISDIQGGDAAAKAALLEQMIILTTS